MKGNYYCSKQISIKICSNQTRIFLIMIEYPNLILIIEQIRCHNLDRIVLRYNKIVKINR